MRLNDVLFGEIALRNSVIGHTELEAAYDILEDRNARGHVRTLSQILIENRLIDSRVAGKIDKMVVRLIEKKGGRAARNVERPAPATRDARPRSRSRPAPVETTSDRRSGYDRRAGSDRRSGEHVPTGRRATDRRAPAPSAAPVPAPAPIQQRRKGNSRSRTALTAVPVQPERKMRYDGPTQVVLPVVRPKSPRKRRPFVRSSHGPLYGLFACLIVVGLGVAYFATRNQSTAKGEASDAQSGELLSHAPGDGPSDELERQDRSGSSSQSNPRAMRAEQIYRQILAKPELYDRVAELRNLALDYHDTPTAKKALDEASRLEAAAGSQDVQVLARILADSDAYIEQGRLGIAQGAMERARNRLVSVDAQSQLEIRITELQTRIALAKSGYDGHILQAIAAQTYGTADSLLTVASSVFGPVEEEWIAKRRDQVFEARSTKFLAQNAGARNPSGRTPLLSLVERVRKRDFAGAFELVSSAAGGTESVDRLAIEQMQRALGLVIEGAGATAHEIREIALRNDLTILGTIIGVKDGRIILRQGTSTFEVHPCDLSDHEMYRLATGLSANNSREYKLGIALIDLYSGKVAEAKASLEKLANRGVDVSAFITRADALLELFPDQRPEAPPPLAASITGDDVASEATTDIDGSLVAALFDPKAFVNYDQGIVYLDYELDGEASFGQDWSVDSGSVRKDPMGMGLRLQQNGFVIGKARFSGNIVVEVQFYANELPGEGSVFSLCFLDAKKRLMQSSYGLQVKGFRRNELKSTGSFGGDPRDIILVGSDMLMELRYETDKNRVASALSGMDRSFIKLSEPLDPFTLCILWQDANLRIRNIKVSGRLDPTWISEAQNP